MHSAVDLKMKSKMALVFWNQAPISKPFLDYLDPASWPDPWMLLESKLFDRNSISLGIFWTMQLDSPRATDLKLAMLRQPKQAWEGLVCVIDDQWVVGYDREQVWNFADIKDVQVMHVYKYDLQKRCIKEISVNSMAFQFS